MTWFLDSETAVLKDVLLCPPDHYRWLPINPVAAASLADSAAFDVEQAQSQFEQMVDAMEQAGVTCRHLEPDPQLHGQVYTRDASQMTPWGPVLTQPRALERRGEYAETLRFFLNDGVQPWRYSSHGTIEGGDIHIIRPGLLLVGYCGARTDEAGARQFAGWFEDEGWEVRLQSFPDHFVHLDTMFCMVEDGLAVACLDVMDDDMVRWLGAQGIRIVPVPYKGAMRLDCNLLSLGADRVISPRHNEPLNGRLRAEGMAVFDPELDLFTRGGGGPRAMTMPLMREPF